MAVTRMYAFRGCPRSAESLPTIAGMRNYLVDVLQRVGQHPSARVAELTPRLWKQHFAANPLRSDLYNISR
ncbi:protein of unknown function [Acidithiobacillus ferrivorans]|uniref:Uncharacterized protein n=1 Tax=Acidithiobacillus ferrivorans TaxID=160808 RepID=A0A060USH1_9PROT|nr:hypothetical protein [Acidithiobacillus ferrivorans]CDQ09748.1 hypothetical protein AFERRI_30394 [Acidithiobacillus ferrivorans]SMH66438.1 protein of unknown function [Acidithiobacillus ferrivorans]